MGRSLLFDGIWFCKCCPFEGWISINILMLFHGFWYCFFHIPSLDLLSIHGWGKVVVIVGDPRPFPRNVLVIYHGWGHMGIFLGSSANINRLAQPLVDLPTILMPGSIKSLDHGYLAHVLCAYSWLGYAWVGDHGVRSNQQGQRFSFNFLPLHFRIWCNLTIHHISFWQVGWFNHQLNTRF